MKICQILASTGDGGLEKHVRELTQCLIAAGHQLIVLAPTSFLKTLPESVDKKAIPAHLSRSNPWLLWQTLSAIKQQQPDIIHAHANKAVALVATLKPFISAPCIGTIHNIKKRTQAYLKMDHIIAVSKQLAVTFPPLKATTIYNGIIPPAPNHIDLHQQFAVDRSKQIFCAVGRLVHAKGFDILLEAISAMDIHLLIVGDGPDKAALQQQIKTLDLTDRVTMTGFRQDSIDIINASAGVIISSRREGFSYVFSEALLLNKPVLASDVPVANELLPDNLIVPTNDIQALKSRLTDCINNYDQWQQQIHALHQHTASELSLNTMCQQTFSLYHHLLQTRSVQQ